MPAGFGAATSSPRTSYEAAVAQTMPVGSSASQDRRPTTSPKTSASFLTDVPVPVPDQQQPAEFSSSVPHRVPRQPPVSHSTRRPARASAVPTGASPTSSGKKKLAPLAHEQQATTSPAVTDPGPSSPKALEPLPAALTPPEEGSSSASSVRRAGGWATRLRDVNSKAQEIEAREEMRRALETHSAARRQAKECYQQGMYEECVEALSRSIAVNSRCDVLYR